MCSSHLLSWCNSQWPTNKDRALSDKQRPTFDRESAPFQHPRRRYWWPAVTDHLSLKTAYGITQSFHGTHPTLEAKDGKQFGNLEAKCRQVSFMYITWQGQEYHSLLFLLDKAEGLAKLPSPLQSLQPTRASKSLIWFLKAPKWSGLGREMLTLAGNVVAMGPFRSRMSCPSLHLECLKKSNDSGRIWWLQEALSHTQNSIKLIPRLTRAPTTLARARPGCHSPRMEVASAAGFSRNFPVMLL